MHARGGSRLSPAHGRYSPADEFPPPDRLGEQQSHPLPNAVQPTPSPSPHLPHALEPVAPEPVKPHEAKSVMFDLQPQEFEYNEEVKEEQRERGRDRGDDRKRERDDHRDGDKRSGRRSRRDRDRDDSSYDSDASDATIELPPRFDQTGHPRKDDRDPLEKKLESVLASLFR